MAVEEKGWSELTPEQRAESLCKGIKELFLTEKIEGFIWIAPADDRYYTNTWGEFGVKTTIVAFLQHLRDAEKAHACTSVAVMK